MIQILNILQSVHLVEKSPDDNCNQEECTICKRKISGSMEDHLSVRL